MIEERFPYYEVNKRAVDGFAALGKHLRCIDEKLRALVELRVSQINGCVYCLDLHARQARQLGEVQQRLDCLAAWPEYPLFEARERTAFAWAEAVTHISESHAPKHLYDELQVHFSEQEIVDLTLIISFMNTWNRLSISFRDKPEPLLEPVAA
jgi:AhpD family alkylhydroperoxidase